MNVKREVGRALFGAAIVGLAYLATIKTDIEAAGYTIEDGVRSARRLFIANGQSPAVGMTEEEVRLMWGKPDHVYDNGGVVVWRYERFAGVLDLVSFRNGRVM